MRENYSPIFLNALLSSKVHKGQIITYMYGIHWFATQKNENFVCIPQIIGELHNAIFMPILG